MTFLRLSALSWVLVASFVAGAAVADPHQLVGFTLNQPLGDQGVFQYNQLCRNAFSDPGVRMCTAVEVLETVAVPSNLSGEAWVLPSGDLESYIGISFNQETCVGWTQTVDNGIPVDGLRVDAAGHFFLGACNSAARVACCAPVPIP